MVASRVYTQEETDYLKSLVEYDSISGIVRVKGVSGVGGITGSGGYRVIHIHKKPYLAHLLAWLAIYGEFPTKCIDHINGNPDDNRIENLREVSVRGNSQNKKKHREGHPLGVTFRSDLSERGLHS